MKPWLEKLTWLSLFSIAMGFMESSVVVYLREIYYPNGFQFPLVTMPPDIALTEVLRETSTLVMLLGMGMLTGKTASQKFSGFLYCFAVWDISYYVFLKALLHWPESLLTWDILFLIPIPWTGPVIAPCLVSLTMIALALPIFYYSELGKETKLTFMECLVLVFGAIIIFFSFIWDYLNYLGLSPAGYGGWALAKPEISNYIPTEFNWGLFAFGELILLYGALVYIHRIKKK